MFMLGCLLQGLFTLGYGLSRNATQIIVLIIVLRAFSGITASFCLSSAVSIIIQNFPGEATQRGFRVHGRCTARGIRDGLRTSGVITGTVGWEWVFFIAEISNAAMHPQGRADILQCLAAVGNGH